MTHDLSLVPTLALLAEIDRRTAVESPPKVEFFGVWPGERAGHFLRDRHGNHSGGPDGYKGRPYAYYPWDCWHGDRAPQDEGLFWHWHHPDLEITILTSWDRSADQRGGCAATFVVHAHVTAEHGMALARESFPAVFKRIESHLGRAVKLAGPVPA